MLPVDLDPREALDFLETLRRGPRPLYLSKSIESSNRIPDFNNGQARLHGKPSIENMAGWFRALGYSKDDTRRLRIVHVAGTKGKGSTCSWIECLLRKHGERTGFPKRTGLYTSPHLITVEERIRINSEKLSEQTFRTYVTEVCTRLAKAKCNAPAYLQFLLLVSLHAFIQEKVDVAIIETHQGGRFDSTNFISNPFVTAITAIGEDHVHQLGPCIEHIAHHKAGIFKRGASAFSSPQQPKVLCVLKDQSRAEKVSFEVVTSPRIPHGAREPEPAAQMENYALAFAVCNDWLQQTRGKELEHQDQSTALATCVWPGRFHIEVSGNTTWFIDGAHNEMSLSKVAGWFGKKSAEGAARRIVIFSNHSYYRNVVKLADTLAESLQDTKVAIDESYFLPLLYSKDATIESQIDALNKCRQQWQQVFPACETPIVTTVAEAFKQIQRKAIKTHVLVTGSLHLVGDMLVTLS